MGREQIIARYRGITGFKLTPQRISILEFLDGNTGHPTADDIFNGIKQEHPTVSVATVYNTVQALRDKGLIVEITIDPERKHYDPNPETHHHVICTECGAIGDIFKDYSSSLALPAEVSASFTITGNHVNFYGLCKGCVELH